MCIAPLGLCEMWAADRGASVPVRSLRSELRILDQKWKRGNRREGSGCRRRRRGEDAGTGGEGGWGGRKVKSEERWM